MIPTRRQSWVDVLSSPATALVLAGLFTLVCFWSVLGDGFLIWDDNVNLTENHSLWGPAGEAFRWMFTNIESVQRYKPLNWVAWRLLGQAFSLNPIAFHALNLVLHTVNAGLLFRVIVKFLASQTSNGSQSRAATLAALAGTLWWALHPLRVEPVAWISGAGYPLATFFALLAVLAFQRHHNEERAHDHLMAIFFFGLSLLSYPAAAALPGLLLALALKREFSFRILPTREVGRLARLLLPYCIMAATTLGVTVVVRFSTSGEIWNQPASLAMVGFDTRIMQAFAVWAWYFTKTLLPLHLAPVYPDFWAFAPSGFRAMASVVAIALISITAWRVRRRCPEVPSFWCAFLLFCVPVLGLTELPFSPADRYTYVPGLALAILSASLLHRGLIAGQKIISGAAFAMIVGCVAMTMNQLEIWHSPEAFFNCAIKSVEPHPAAGNLHWRLGLHYLAVQQNVKAAAEFEAVMRLNPGDNEAARYLRILRSRSMAGAEGVPLEKFPEVDFSR